MKLAFFGGIYSNYLALEQAIRDAKRRNVDAVYCLGDLGAFGPHPDRVFPVLQEHGIVCVQGNYDDSIGNKLDDCQCGYTDPNDNEFAQLSYDYTLANTSDSNKAFLRRLPSEIRLSVDGLTFLLCHGSPRRTNEFLWESHHKHLISASACSRSQRSRHCRYSFGDTLGSHSARREARDVNCGVLGRPENDGRTSVWYSVIRTGSDADRTANTCVTPTENVRISVDFVPIEYDYRTLADEMRSERLPEEFVATVLTGWWTTCLEILPSRERRAGKY